MRCRRGLARTIRISVPQIGSGGKHVYWLLLSHNGPRDVSEADQILDASGLTCPLPLLKAKQALNKLETGAVLEVLCTDSSSVRDFRVFSEQSGHPLLKSEEEEGQYTYWLRKA